MLIMDPMHSVDLLSVEKEVDKQDHACIFLYLWAFILVFFFFFTMSSFLKKKDIQEPKWLPKETKELLHQVYNLLQNTQDIKNGPTLRGLFSVRYCFFYLVCCLEFNFHSCLVFHNNAEPQALLLLKGKKNIISPPEGLIFITNKTQTSVKLKEH